MSYTAATLPRTRHEVGMWNSVDATEERLAARPDGRAFVARHADQRRELRELAVAAVERAGIVHLAALDLEHRRALEILQRHDAEPVAHEPQRQRFDLGGIGTR